MRIAWLMAIGLPLMACATTPPVSVTPAPLLQIAGQFYPAEPARLRAAVDGYLRDALPPRALDPIAIVVPHAGYVFSGQIAADGYRYLAGTQIDTVVILGANHTGRGDQRLAVFDGQSVSTPLGRVQVDRDLAIRLVNDTAGAVLDAFAQQGEHSIAVQIPFLQSVLPRAKILPIVVGSSDPGLCARLGSSLAKLLKGRRAALVASSDLSHYPTQRDALIVDRRTLGAIASLEPDVFRAAMVRTDEMRPAGLETSACGEGAVCVVMEAARALGARRAVVVSYANSGDTIVGAASRAVGYGAVVFGRGAGGADVTALTRARPDVVNALNADDQRVLLRLARDTLVRWLASGTVPLPRGGSPRLLREVGAFVTLRKRGELRGCIGSVQAQGTLIRLVSAMAFESAFRDGRFAPVRADELADIDVEISVLTPPRPVAGPADVVVGRDGVMLRVDGRTAVFLPQVATEQRWTRDQMLDNLAEKAGLAASAWRGRGAELLTFQAEIFSEATAANR